MGHCSRDFYKTNKQQRSVPVIATLPMSGPLIGLSRAGAVLFL